MNNKKWYLQGIKDGTPIALGYFAVGFTLGIAAKAMGMGPAQSGLMSFLMHASAGEFAVLTVIADNAGFIAMAFTMLIINMRYFLMSCSLSQKIPSDTSLLKRLLLSYFVTDEIFGISASVKGELNPYYPYGAATVASPGWVLGTILGAAAGNILPPSLSSAFSVAIYGMFLAVVIPASKQDRTIAVVVTASMAASAAFSFLPYFKEISAGTQIIILTIVIASAAAIINPVKNDRISRETKKDADKLSAAEENEVSK
ncbi:AzlC family ABC transporter permease [Ihubacter sp. rT4E-8]|uniref:AzlC family ABC transporter permease n=1 Tax=Ihubacter sp. rT4E-8 TaxID=3242369 RepID=UPI003CF2413E